MRALLFLLIFSLGFSQTNDPMFLEKDQKAPFEGTLMEEVDANYLVDAEGKYLDLVPKFERVSSNYVVLKALNLQAEKSYTNQIDLLLKRGTSYERQIKGLKIVIVVGIPVSFLGGVAGGTYATIKLSEYIYDHLKKITSEP